MPFPPAIAEALASLTLDPKTRDRIGRITFMDAGHGFDTFGMHPSFVAFGASVLGPLYDKYFRTISHGAENIPDSGARGGSIWTDVGDPAGERMERAPGRFPMPRRHR